MKKLFIGACYLETSKENLDRFINELYLSFYKKDRLRHISRNDKRLPNIKVTSDIFSIPIYFKDKSNKEHRIYLDGRAHLNNLIIDTISIVGEEFNLTEYHSILDVLKKLTSKVEGYILFANNSKIGRIKKGNIDEDKTLMKEIYSLSPEQRNDEHNEIFQWFLEFETETDK